MLNILRKVCYLSLFLKTSSKCEVQSRSVLNTAVLKKNILSSIVLKYPIKSKSRYRFSFIEREKPSNKDSTISSRLGIPRNEKKRMNKEHVYLVHNAYPSSSSWASFRFSQNAFKYRMAHLVEGDNTTVCGCRHGIAGVVYRQCLRLKTWVVVAMGG